jgi:carboxyl-terminal processing protease
MLRQVSQDVEKNFYDPSLHGLDWQRLTAQASNDISRSNSWGDMFVAIFALLDNLHDSHTVFIAPQRNVRREFGFEAKPFGDRILIYKVKESGPAWEAGLRPGDELLTVNGFRAERSTFFQLMLYLRALQPVDIMQLRASRGGGPPRSVEVRAKTTTQARVMEVFNSVNFNQLLREAEDQQKQFNEVGHEDLGNEVGYLRVESFVAEPGYLYHVMKKARDSQVVVVDLRGNLGGAIEDLKFLASFFVDQPTEMAQMVGRKRTVSLTAKPEHPTIAGPMIVLVDSETASGGEMFARYFQVSRRAVVVGDKTSGRVNEARLFSEKLGQDTIIPYSVEVAVARVLLPGGEELENRGVNPDHLCIPTPADLREGRDPCKDLALSACA